MAEGTATSSSSSSSSSSSAPGADGSSGGGGVAGVRVFVDESVAGGTRICVLRGPLERLARATRLQHAMLRPPQALDADTDALRPLTGDRGYYTAPLTDDCLVWDRNAAAAADDGFPPLSEFEVSTLPDGGLTDLDAVCLARGSHAAQSGGKALVVRVRRVSRVFDYAKLADAPQGAGARYPCKFEMLVEDATRAVRAVVWNRLALRTRPLIRAGDVLLLHGARRKLYNEEFELSLNAVHGRHTVQKVCVDRLGTALCSLSLSLSLPLSSLSLFMTLVDIHPMFHTEVLARYLTRVYVV